MTDQAATADHEPATPAPARHTLAGHGLRNLSEIRTFFRTNETPVFFVGATAFNLLGIDRWVRNFSFVVYYDSWDGFHPRVFSPPLIEHAEFASGEDINNYLLTHPAVVKRIDDAARASGERPKIAMVFFDAETERICRAQGWDLILPSHELRNRLDSKLETTRLGNEAGAPSVPNVMTSVESYPELQAACAAAGLGDDLVVQAAYGDSGKTTFFIASESDWNKYATEIVGEEVKIMKRINNKAVAVEAVNTRHGTIVGPFMTDLTGYPELTPYRGGWCGDDLSPDSLTLSQRTRALEHVRKLGDRLRGEGYKGYFEVDVLVDTDTDEVYLGELNPRFSGVTSMTNVTAGAYADVPLFLFHLLDHLDVDYELDVDDINARWLELAAIDDWSQLIMKTSDPTIRLITEAPSTGVYAFDADGALQFLRPGLDWHSLAGSDEAFFLRVYGKGDYLFKGADIGILVTKNRMQTEEKTLTPLARNFITSIGERYAAAPLAETAPQPANLLAYLK